jgi:hypothetical protein
MFYGQSVANDAGYGYEEEQEYDHSDRYRYSAKSDLLIIVACVAFECVQLIETVSSVTTFATAGYARYAYILPFTLMNSEIV